MKLTKEQFEAAMRIISRHHSVMIKVNMPVNNFVGHLGQSEYSIHVVRGCAGLTKDLIEAGFDIQMDANGMNVFKI